MIPLILASHQLVSQDQTADYPILWHMTTVKRRDLLIFESYSTETVGNQGVLPLSMIIIPGDTHLALDMDLISVVGIRVEGVDP